jgi:hypothetical protein
MKHLTNRSPCKAQLHSPGVACVQNAQAVGIRVGSLQDMTKIEARALADATVTEETMRFFC